MNASEVVAELKALGSEGVKRILRNHGAPEPVFGVKVGDLKRIQKRIRKDHVLALELYDTGIYDAMYLAGLIAEPAKMREQDLNRWVEKAVGGGLGAATVSPIAAESPHGWKVATKWIESDKEHVAESGWVTLGRLAGKPGGETGITEWKRLLNRVEKTIHQERNFVRYAMVMFVIAVGTGIEGMSEMGMAAAQRIGKVHVDMGNTACKVPDAVQYIQKIQEKRSPGKKKAVKC